MSKPANKTVIGCFVVGAIALVVVAIVVLGSGKFFKKTVPAVCYFEGSVGGLNVGAPVVFRGVKVGSVTDVKLRAVPDPKGTVEFRIPVFFEIEPENIEIEKDIRREPGKDLKRIVDLGLRAKLETQSIVTGQRQITLDLAPDKPARFVGADPGYTEIPTIPTPLEEFVKKIQNLPIDEIFEKLRSTLAEVEKVVKSPEITKTLQSVSEAAGEAKALVANINSQVTPLASNANETIKDLQKLLKDVDQRVSVLSSDLGSTVKDVQKLVQNVNDEVKPISSSLTETLKDVQGLVRNADGKIDRLGPSIEVALQAATESLRQAQATLKTIGGATGEDSAVIHQLTQALKELASASRSIRALANSLERRPESIIRGK
jgi:paraquat-inducible protein B